MIKKKINGFNVVLCENISRDEIKELLKDNVCVCVINHSKDVNILYLDTGKVKLIYDYLDKNNLFYYWDTFEGVAEYIFPKENESNILDFVKLKGVK